MFSSTTSADRYRSVLLGGLGGLIFVVVFAFAYRQMDPAHYAHRDDGVITLSHARNLVDQGFIGVEPSGQRVEGFSAPLQFWVYAAVYSVTGMGWHAFGTFQTYFCAFWMGFFCIRMFEERKIVGLLLTVLLASLLTHHARFLGWHGSGMENAWLHAMIAALLWLTKSAMDKGQLPWYFGIVFGVALLVRLDTIFHLLPLLLLFAVGYGLHWRSLRGFGVAGIALGVWALYQCWRFYYFGDWSPNTSLAQGIDPVWNLHRLLVADMAWLQEGARHGLGNLQVHGAWLLLPCLLLLPFVRLQPGSRWVVIACLLLVFTSFFNPLVFGVTRLDPVRTTTFATLAVGLLIVQVLCAVPWRRDWFALPVAAAALVAVALAWPIFQAPRPKLCCGINTFQGFTDEAFAFQEANHLHRVTLASPDLGKLSYQKKFNLFDMGFLGSPIVTHLRAQPDALRSYFYDFALPDLVETHGEWCLLHARIFADPRFREMYTPLHETRHDYLETYGGDWPTVTEGMFARKALYADSNSPEYQLIQALRLKLSLKPIRLALVTAIRQNEPSAHQYVVRSAYRFLPEFREAGLEDELIDLFAQTPTAAYDQAILGSAWQSDWVHRALDGLRPWLQASEGAKFLPKPAHPPIVIWEQGRFRVYMGAGRKCWVSIFNPSPEDLQSTWFVHSYAKHAGMVSSPNRWNADFLDFSWDPACETVVNSEHIYPVELPKYPIKGILVGNNFQGKIGFTAHIKWWPWRF